MEAAAVVAAPIVASDTRHLFHNRHVDCSVLGCAKRSVEARPFTLTASASSTHSVSSG